MKRLIAISLIVLYISSNTEFHEAFRLPVLIEHYSEHKEKSNDLSFWEFLAMHYKTNVAHDEHDNQLPFKDPGHSFVASVSALLVQKIVLQEGHLVAPVNHSSFYTEADITSPLSEIFQPPRIS